MDKKFIGPIEKQPVLPLPEDTPKNIGEIKERDGAKLKIEMEYNCPSCGGSGPCQNYDHCKNAQRQFAEKEEAERIEREKNIPKWKRI